MPHSIMSRFSPGAASHHEDDPATPTRTRPPRDDTRTNTLISPDSSSSPMVSFGTHSSSNNNDHILSFTRVNGIGLWKSWTRNFKTPLLALLDLIDNAVDAALAEDTDVERGKEEKDSPAGRRNRGERSSFRGRIEVSADVFKVDNKQEIERDRVPHHHGTRYRNRRRNAPPTTITTGLKLMNNSSRPIKDLAEVLEVYSSGKGQNEDAASSIGENGVGLKQGCATLSDLSFVLTRNETEGFGLGIVASELQREEGVRLPSFAFESTTVEGIRLELADLCTSGGGGGGDLTDVGICLRRYGEGNLEAGIERIVRHMGTMADVKNGDGDNDGEGWGTEDHVFCLLLHRLKHGAKRGGVEDNPPSSDHEDEGNEETRETGDGDAETCRLRAVGFLSELTKELPRHYIHVPPTATVRVAGERIRFCHWQTHLIELSSFDLIIDPDHPFTTADDWKEPQSDAAYRLRIFCGFDPVRLASKTEPSSMSLLVYSRRSGRLVKHEADARSLVGLNGSGTYFGQGLTVLVDDIEGNLPLSPTKQDVAFGEQSRGDVHKTNLYAWVGAVAHAYWTHHLETKCGPGKKKAVLTAKVRAFATDSDLGDDILVGTLEESQWTTLEEVPWYRTHLGAIRCKKTYKEVPGRDTVRWFEADQNLAESSSSPRTKKRGRADNYGCKQKPIDIDSSSELEVAVDDFLPLVGDTSRRKRRRPDFYAPAKGEVVRHRGSNGRMGSKGAISEGEEDAMVDGLSSREDLLKALRQARNELSKQKRKAHREAKEKSAEISSLRKRVAALERTQKVTTTAASSGPSDRDLKLEEENHKIRRAMQNLHHSLRAERDKNHMLQERADEFRREAEQNGEALQRYEDYAARLQRQLDALQSVEEDEGVVDI